MAEQEGQKRNFLDRTMRVHVDWFIGMMAIFVMNFLYVWDLLPVVRGALLIVAIMLFMRVLVVRRV